ncbi:MAG: hypothetical protein J6U51_07610 [Bacteroidales bacterium]|nr:hypothetical protein [Bacteroidales bacterium]
MKNQKLTRVALRYHALYLDIDREEIDMSSEVTVPVLAFTARLKENGFTLSEELVRALNSAKTDVLLSITDTINDVMGCNLNWAPLVKGWDVPTGESYFDHLITLFVNVCDLKEKVSGTKLPCGHYIPEGTFPIERYNGCPFCGTPFEKGDLVYKGQGSKLKELRLFTEEDIKRLYTTLLISATPLDATQRETLETLLSVYDLPDGVSINMKETLMLVVKTLVANGRDDEAAKLMKTPADVLRYLWFLKTGNVQVIEPKTLIAHSRRLYYHMWGALDRGADASKEMKKKLQLKYDRKTCRMVAKWLNGMNISSRQAAENMNPKRGVWVRMIRALRLGEYSRKSGFENLAELLDVFYKQEYDTWQGKVDDARIHNDADTVIRMLKERPGLFARCLFATMLRFGKEKTLSAFNDVSHKLPARLLLALGNTAELYFSDLQTRLARPITGGTVKIPANKLLALYSTEEKMDMIAAINELFKSSMERRFASLHTDSKTMYIDSSLYNIPISIGDRSATIQDTSCALMGTRFPIEGDNIRLFMQWGKGLDAQHMDMDLSCKIALPDDKVSECAYYYLETKGAKHSGDIRFIPEMVGTAEYIELSMPELIDAGARYVTFTCNAYSEGTLSPNLVVGWMDSIHQMKISEKNGVAYDPSCVQHMVRISENNISKGLVFGVLDVEKREIIWLEMPFTSQTIKGCDTYSVEMLLHKLESKLSVGELLELKAAAQNLYVVDTPNSADEVYTYEWALNPADVSLLLSV